MPRIIYFWSLDVFRKQPAPASSPSNAPANKQLAFCPSGKPFLAPPLPHLAALLSVGRGFLFLFLLFFLLRNREMSPEMAPLNEWSPDDARTRIERREGGKRRRRRNSPDGGVGRGETRCCSSKIVCRMDTRGM